MNTDTPNTASPNAASPNTATAGTGIPDTDAPFAAAGAASALGWYPDYARVLERPTEGRMISGVAQGLANYFGVEATIVRIAFVVLALIGGLGIPLYLAGWLLMPEAWSGWSVADDLLQHLGRS